MINILDPCRLTKSFSLKITGIPQMYKLKVSEMRKTVNKMKSRLYHKEVLNFFFIWWWRGWQSHVMQCFKIICKLRVIKITTHNFVLFTNEGFFYSLCYFFFIKYRSKNQTNLILILTTIICMKDVDYFTKYKNLEHKFLHLVIKIKKILLFEVK